jgi:hypothetical protein
VNIQDATLMFVTESDAHPTVQRRAQTIYDQLSSGEHVPYTMLQDLIDEASGKGVLQALARKYSPTAYESIIMPILSEIGRYKPIHSTQQFGTP